MIIEMEQFFAIALGLDGVQIAVILISGISFLLMFGIASAKGDFQGLVKTTLENDESQRRRKSH